MARKFPISNSRPMPEIMMTSLIDLAFLLLTTFIITFPLVEQGIPVNLPRGAARELKPDKSRVVTVDVKGGVFLDDAPVSVEELRATMLKLGRSDPDTTVRLRADKGVDYGSVVRVLKVLHDAKIARMALVTEGSESPSR
jgi:biopolymer transport protein TolR